MTGGVYDAGAGGSPVLVGVQCNGTENTILDCPLLISSDCSTRELAAVVCQGKCVSDHSSVDD